MGFFDKIVKSIFGSKNDRDLKEMMPLVTAINAEYEKLKNVSNDELRAKTSEFKSRIQTHLSEIDNQIADIRSKAEAEEELQAKDNYYKKIEEIRKERNKEIEVILEQILPEAFAVVKEAAFRFANNEFVESSATDLDREMAVKYQNITIHGDKARYANNWLAAGVPVKWNMVHYDVQLIGGIVLH